MSRRRPNYTTKAAVKGKTLKATPETAEAARRKPRKQDWVAAGVAVLIVIAMVASAVVPFFMP